MNAVLFYFEVQNKLFDFSVYYMYNNSNFEKTESGDSF